MTYELIGFDIVTLEVVYREYTTSKKKLVLFEAISNKPDSKILFSTKRQYSRRRKPIIFLAGGKYPNERLLLQAL
jgi:hypothetical protein